MLAPMNENIPSEKVQTGQHGRPDNASDRCGKTEAAYPPGHLLTSRDVADRWSCCVHSVRRRKDLRPVRFNQRMLRYRLADIEAIERAAQ